VAKEVALRCTKSEFDALEEADETQFVPRDTHQLGYPPEQVYTMPHYGLALPRLQRGVAPSHGTVDPHRETYDRVPPGEVEVRRGDHVDATDGAIGRVEGLVIDPTDHHVTHILLDEGHRWNEKRVAIPITAVTRVGEIIRLSLTTDEVRNLPSVDLDHPE
jgi:sporulation protein YlmC with PRC-barrel domain